MAQIVNPRNGGTSQGFNPNVDNSIKTANASAVSKVIWYLTFILIIPMFIHVSMKNNLNRQQNKVNETAAGIDVQLKKRRDTLIKLVDATKNYVNYEKSFMTDVVKLRKMGTTSPAALNEATSSMMGRLFAVSERYPETKANESVQKLMEESTYLEREIAAARRIYNSEVRIFNQRLFTFPSAVPATSLGLATLPYFEASETDRKDVSINF